MAPLSKVTLNSGIVQWQRTVWGSKRINLVSTIHMNIYGVLASSKRNSFLKHTVNFMENGDHFVDLMLAKSEEGFTL